MGHGIIPAHLSSSPPHRQGFRIAFIMSANGDAYFQIFPSGINIFECFISIYKVVGILSKIQKTIQLYLISGF